MKLYLKTHVDAKENKDYQLGVELKKLNIDIQDLIQKNMRICARSKRTWS